MADGGGEALHVEVAESLTHIPRAEWDALANPPDRPYDPFLSWGFLEALESTSCACALEGWTPAHLIARDSSGALVGVVPLYLKDHSQGEYVFDHSWADAFYRAGGHYYPKLQGSVPFTPATGRRILTNDPSVEAALVEAATTLMRRAQASSLHFTFVDAEQTQRLNALGLMTRTGVQYHWFNAGYATFDDFLAALSSGKRKNIRKERQRVQHGLTIKRLQGADISSADWDFFYRCYMDTGSRKWGSPYLNRAFFEVIGERMADRILLFVAEENGNPIASAINFLGGDTLFGRYWGCVAYREFLHFELCYYQAIDFAIEHGLKRVEAGAQGQHKIARGYAPVPTYSLHAIAHPGLRSAISKFLEAETPAMIEEIETLAEHIPFKK
ncbi:MAG: GNAT family N-acetyltransferase, partial [Caulobacterales bacterium]